MNEHSESHFEGAFENILAGNHKEAAVILEEKHKVLELKPESPFSKLQWS